MEPPPATREGALFLKRVGILHRVTLEEVPAPFAIRATATAKAAELALAESSR
jgi:hypothetical protein